MSESDPRWWHKVTPKPFKCTGVDPSKHVVFMVWEPHWATWEESDIDSLCACFAGAYFFEFLMIFLTLGSKWFQNRFPNYVQMVALLAKAPRSGHNGVQVGSGVPNLLSNGVPEYPKMVQNGGFQASRMVSGVLNFWSICFQITSTWYLCRCSFV